MYIIHTVTITVLTTHTRRVDNVELIVLLLMLMNTVRRRTASKRRDFVCPLSPSSASTVIRRSSAVNKEENMMMMLNNRDCTQWLQQQTTIAAALIHCTKVAHIPHSKFKNDEPFMLSRVITMIQVDYYDSYLCQILEVSICVYLGLIYDGVLAHCLTLYI